MRDILTSIPEIDAAFGRLNRTMTVLAGKAGGGKTLGLIHIALKMASSGIRVMFVQSPSDGSDMVGKMIAGMINDLDSSDRMRAEEAARNFFLTRLPNATAESLKHSFLRSPGGLLERDPMVVIIDGYGDYPNLRRDLCIQESFQNLKNVAVRMLGLSVILSLCSDGNPIFSVCDNVLASHCEHHPDRTVVIIAPIRSRGFGLVSSGSGALESIRSMAISFEVKNASIEGLRHVPDWKTSISNAINGIMWQLPMSDVDMENLFPEDIDPML